VCAARGQSHLHNYSVSLNAFGHLLGNPGEEPTHVSYQFVVQVCRESGCETRDAVQAEGDALERILCMVFQVYVLLAILESIDDTRSDDHILNRLVDLIAEVLREKVVRYECVRGAR